MPDITDLFGKASIDTDYAIATTVKTARLAGETVLEAFDVGKFADDTPVYFVTYKKTVDPLTSEVTVSELVSWKGLINSGANTITNLVVAPGYVDDGNDVGDFIECIPTSHWVNSMINGIFVGHNPDGTFKASAIRSALGITPGSFAGWENLGHTVGTITPKGNRSYEITLTGVDARSQLTEGMRARTTRSVAASDTSFLLDGSNDYYVKTAPNKMGFTDDFATGFWIYPTAYPTTFAGIASRYNGTSGWEFLMDSKGSIILIGHNAGSSNFRGVTSYQSVPLNRWTFVAAQLDMSAHTPTPTTSYVMMNGVDVPAYVSQSGTNPGSLVAAGNLEIGSTNGGTNAFSGYIGDGGIFSAKVTQATMLGYMNQKLTGSEANLASGYINGSVNDVNTTTPNNLVATNGATTITNAPYGNRGASTTLDYGVIMTKPVYALSNTTFTVQVPEGCTLPTTGGIASIDYATADIPYGFPRAKGRWELRAVQMSNPTGTTLAQNTWLNPQGLRILTPAGAWIAGYELNPTGYKPSSGSIDLMTTLSTSPTAESDRELSSFAQSEQATGGTISLRVNVTRRKQIEVSTPTLLYGNILTTRAGGVDAAGWTPEIPAILKLENAYV